MKDELFAEILESAREGGAILRDEKPASRKFVVEPLDAKEFASEKIPPVHPGEVLYEDWLIPLGMSQSKLANAMGVPRTRIYKIVQGKRAINAETALRLARALGTSPEFWLRLQMMYGLRVAQETFGEVISQEVISIVV